MENLQYLFTAYALIWVILFVYISRLQRRTKSLQEELERLEKDLEEQASTPSPQ
jgi:CcmD family protein